jgi:restriction system protein
MAIPDYQTLMLPLLRAVKDGQEHTVGEVVQRLSDEFGLTREEREQLLPSDRVALMRNRVGWTTTYLRKAGLLESPRRGVIRISGRGTELLREGPSRIDVEVLKRFPEFRAFRSIRREPSGDDEESRDEPPGVSLDQTPEEALEGAYQRPRADLEADLLEQVKGSTPVFFERLVANSLVKMGYGGPPRVPSRSPRPL